MKNYNINNIIGIIFIIITFLILLRTCSINSKVNKLNKNIENVNKEIIIIKDSMVTFGKLKDKLDILKYEIELNTIRASKRTIIDINREKELEERIQKYYNKK